MPPVYIREQGAVVRKQGERLIVTLDKKKLLDLPLVHLDQLVLFGNVQLTAQAVSMLLLNEIDVVFMSKYGKFRGRLMNTGSKFAGLRHAQLRKMSDATANLAIARQVVVGKLHNQRGMLQTHTGEAPVFSRGRVSQSIGGISRMMEQARRTKSPDSLRGFEGSAGAGYWAAFKVLLKNGGLGFKGRKYFPAPDPVNALLSFGYGLLRKDVEAAVQLVGLDPYLGFFHTIDYGRPSLALDMMEEFRPVLVDPVVLGLINEGHISGGNFERTPDPKLPVRLTGSTADLLIARYEERLASRVMHADAGGQTSLRRVIELQVRRLSKVVLGKAKGYHPFTVENGKGASHAIVRKTS